MKQLVASCLLLLATIGAGPKASEEKLRYLRQLSDKTQSECVFTLQSGAEGWSIVSITERGPTKMTVTARYDAQDRLTSAEATLAKAGQTQAVRIAIADGTAKVKRDGQEPQQFEVPKGVIVTSAPDWTDIFLLCRRYHRQQGGKQEFGGLWVHPEQAAQRLTFVIERVGTAPIDHEGKKMELDRFAIRIRNNSDYLAWADGNGRLIKLLSLPAKESAATELVLEGFEKAVKELRPPQK
jgi:hypothetical protein